MLVFHIGLPKTATTFLQNSIFRQAEGVQMIHRKDGADAQYLISAIRHISSDSALKYLWQSRQALRALKKVDVVTPVLIVAAENMSVSRTSFWKGRGVGPCQVAERLDKMRNVLGRDAQDFRIVVGVRRQDRWLASRYAGSSASFSGFSQEDFEKRLNEIASSPVLSPPYDWLDYAWVREAFARYFAKDEFMFVPTEQLDTDTATVLGKLGKFLGNIDLLAPLDAAQAPDGTARRNVHATSPNRWPLRNGKGDVTLTESLSRKILDRFARSNEQFQQFVAVNYLP